MKPNPDRRFWIALLILVILKLGLHLATNHRYGFHRDEYYFIACGEHLDWGYVDHSPGVAVVAKLSRALFGDSIRSIRFFPALAGAWMVLLVGLVVRELGGGLYATVLAGVSFLIAPLFLRSNGMLTIVVFDQFFWVLSAYFLIRALKTNRPRYWILLGITMGLGLMTKHTMLFFGFGLAVGLLLTSDRKRFATRWPWITAAVALSIFLPNILWQIEHGWPTLQFLREINSSVMGRISPFEFTLGQILYLHPANVLVWVPGLWFFFFHREGKRYRIFGWIFVIVFALLALMKSKIYYLGPAFPVLFAGGACAIEGWLRAPGLKWVRATLVVILLLIGALMAPLSVPLLSIEGFHRYVSLFAGIVPNSREVAGDYRDMFGWEEQVEAVARVYHALPEEEKKGCAIFTDNYGEAGAIDYYGARYGLPKAISGHNSYYLWGPGDYAGGTMIVVGIREDELEGVFTDIQLAEIVRNEYAMESEVHILVCRGLTVTPEGLWKLTKGYG